VISERLREGVRAAVDLPTPYYLFDLDAVGQTAQSMVKAWQECFPRFTLAYSYKTNALPGVTTLLQKCGAAAEVVSGAELAAALADGFTADRIYFDGPVKQAGELDIAIAEGCLIQADSLTEIQALTERARHGVEPRVSLRLSVPRGRRRWSRFGLVPEEVAEARALLADARVPIQGIHFNTGLHPLDPGPYRAVLRHWRETLRELMDGSDGPFSVDIGGGFPAASCAPGRELPPWSVYAEGVAAELAQLGLPPERLHLIIEPGRSIVEDHAVLVASVAAHKRRRRRDTIVLDAGTNLVRSINAWHHPVEFLSPGGVRYDVYGAMCYESDLFAEAVEGPADLQLGDRVVVGAAGAYDIPSANVWLRPHPAVYALAEAGATPVLMREPGSEIR